VESGGGVRKSASWPSLTHFGQFLLVNVSVPGPEEKLSDVLHKLDEPSLSKLVRDHQHGKLHVSILHLTPSSAPMQKRCAPPALACTAFAITSLGSIKREAFGPVPKCADWLQ
jgi:hypothetical protein